MISIRHGSKVDFTSATLKSFNEDLNTLEVFAFARDEAEKLSGQLLLDVANCLLDVVTWITSHGRFLVQTNPGSNC